MNDDRQLIIEKARELSSRISDHRISKNYNDLRLQMNNDRKAQDLYARLVAMGDEINSSMLREGHIGDMRSSEYALLQNDLEGNPLVKDFIRSQREYLDLLKNVIEMIKGPGQ